MSELSKVLKPSGVILITREKYSNGDDREFYYERDSYLTVRRYHRYGGSMDLSRIRRYFNIIRIGRVRTN